MLLLVAMLTDLPLLGKNPLPPPADLPRSSIGSILPGLSSASGASCGMMVLGGFALATGSPAAAAAAGSLSAAVPVRPKSNAASVPREFPFERPPAASGTELVTVVMLWTSAACAFFFPRQQHSRRINSISASPATPAITAMTIVCLSDVDRDFVPDPVPPAPAVPGSAVAVPDPLVLLCVPPPAALLVAVPEPARVEVASVVGADVEPPAVPVFCVAERVDVGAVTVKTVVELELPPVL